MAISAEKKRHYKIICEFYDFNERLIMNIKYSQKPFEEILENYKTVKKFLNGDDVFDGEQLKFFKEYFKTIGTTDAQSQLTYLEEMRITLKKFKSESENNYKKYGLLYLKLCVSCGILLAVLLA